MAPSHKEKPWSWNSLTTLNPVADTLHTSSQAKMMSPYWFLLHLSLFPSLYSQRVPPETASFDIACCFLFVLSAFRLLSVMLPPPLVPLLASGIVSLNKVTFICGLYSKNTDTGLKKMSVCLPSFIYLFFIFPDLPLHLATAWKKKQKFFWYEHIVFFFVRPTAVVTV